MLWLNAGIFRKQPLFFLIYLKSPANALQTTSFRNPLLQIENEEAEDRLLGAQPSILLQWWLNTEIKHLEIKISLYIHFGWASENTTNQIKFGC